MALDERRIRQAQAWRAKHCASGEKLNSETGGAIHDAGSSGELEQRFRQRDLPLAREITFAEAQQFRRPKDIKEAFKLLYAVPWKGWL